MSDREKIVGRCQPGVERLPHSAGSRFVGKGLGGGWSSHGMTCSPDCPKACVGPATRSTVSPASRRPTALQQGAPRNVLMVLGCPPSMDLLLIFRCVFLAVKHGSFLLVETVCRCQLFPSEAFPPALLPSMSWVQGTASSLPHDVYRLVAGNVHGRKVRLPREENLTLSVQIQHIFVEFL